MKLIVLVLSFMSSMALASSNGYDLKMDLSMNGKHVSSPQLIVKAGEKATINQNTNGIENFIEVVATEGSIQNHKGILMNFVVGVIGKNGERIIKSTPQILAKENQAAQITVGENSTETVSLTVIAKRKAL